MELTTAPKLATALEGLVATALGHLLTEQLLKVRLRIFVAIDRPGMCFQQYIAAAGRCYFSLSLHTCGCAFFDGLSTLEELLARTVTG